MRLQDIAEKIKSGELTLDYNGHSCNPGDFLRRYESLKEGAEGKHDGKWDEKEKEKTKEEVDADMREHYQRQLDRETQPGEMIFMGMSDGEQCWGCARRLQWDLGENKLTLAYWFDADHDTGRKWINGGNMLGDFVPLPGRCEHEKREAIKGKINIQSRLIFANYFHPHSEDGPEEEQYQDHYSLNFHLGRINITKYKAERNVAYGQLGNMAFGVFVNEDKTSIILGDHCIADRIIDAIEDDAERTAAYENTDYNELSQIEGHKMIGSMSVQVWRWEATDFNTIKDNYDEIVKGQPDGTIELEVPHGDWEFEHYYRTGCPEDNETIFARLKLVRK